MKVTDTQVISYYHKGSAPVPDSKILISSVTAAEFLLIQSVEPTTANYYPILPSRLKHRMGGTLGGPSVSSMLFDSKKHAASGKHRTDQLILDFNGKMPSFIEFGSMAISQIINDGHKDIFSASISHLEKPLQKKLREKFEFLINTGVQCLPVTPAIAEVGMNILGQFLDRYEAKQNQRNTINDILILSTAIENSFPLLTEDNLLKRFTAELLGAPLSVPCTDRLLIDFTVPEIVDRRRSFESKSYINRGWQVIERRRTRQFKT